MSPPRRPPAPPELMDELLGEILLRIPPDEPADLVRAALVCKPWLRVLADPAFRRGYRERHRRPPLLGFIHNLYHDGPIPRFVSTTASSPCSTPALNCRSWRALDSRHGRVLIHRFAPNDLVVWDPVTGDQEHLPLPPYSYTYYTGAVLCAAAGCDHLDCTGGPFRLVFVVVGTHDEETVTRAIVYSSETRGWSVMATVDLSASTMVDLYYYIATKPSILIGDSLYFTFQGIRAGMAILKYDLVRRGLSAIDAPEACECDQMGIVRAAEDGGLGFATVEGNNLHLWSWLTGDGNSGEWTLRRVIQLQSLLRSNPSLPPKVIGFAEGRDTIFLETDIAVFTLEINSEKMRKVGEAGSYYNNVLPYMSFCAPVSL